MSNLLPPNATELERRLAETGACIAEIPVPIQDIASASTCPAEVLPFLAFERSVDRWDANWREATKRAVIESSFVVHQRKGTVSAIRRAIEPLGFQVRVVAWYETQPEGQRGTFHLDLEAGKTGATEETLVTVERLVDDVKPLSRHLASVAIGVASSGTHAISAAAYFGDVVTVYPPPAPSLTTSSRIAVSGALHVIDTLTISQ